MAYIIYFGIVIVISLAILITMLIDSSYKDEAVDTSRYFTGRVINIWEHSGWSDSMYFLDYKKRRITGHIKQKPIIGDEIRAQMESGKIARFVVIEAEYPRDPPDQFFCTVADLGYLENNIKVKFQ